MTKRFLSVSLPVRVARLHNKHARFSDPPPSDLQMIFFYRRKIFYRAS